MATMIDPKDLAGSQTATEPTEKDVAGTDGGESPAAEKPAPERKKPEALTDVVASKLGADDQEQEQEQDVPGDGDEPENGSVLMGLMDVLDAGDANDEPEGKPAQPAQLEKQESTARQESVESAPSGGDYGLTAEQQATYAGSIPVIEKVAAAVAAKHLRAIEKRIKAIEGRLDDAIKRASFAESYVSTAGKEQFQSRLASLLPNIHEITRDPGFKAWLDTNVPGTKIKRRDALRDAYNDFDADRAAEILKGFGSGKRDTVPAGAAAPAGVGSPASGRGGKEATVENILSVKTDLGSKFASRQIGRREHMEVTRVLDGFLNRMYKGEKVYVGEIMEAVKAVADKMA